MANLQLIGGLFQNWLGHATWLGDFSGGQATSGLAFWIGSTNVVDALITGSMRSAFIWQSLLHILILSRLISL